MLKVILGAVVGFIVWSTLWVGSDQIMSAISPNWYGKFQADFNFALANNLTFVPDSTILIMNLVRSIIVSIISGFAAVTIARENRKTPLFLGVLLLAFGIFVELLAWNCLPLWYHLSFLILLIPMSVLGGKLKRVSPARRALVS